MSAVHFVNHTDYTRDFYRRIARYRVFHGTNGLIIAVAITLLCASGASRLNENANDRGAWMMLLMGLVLLPLLGYAVPYFTTVHGYRAAMKDTKGKPLIVTTEITKNEVTVRNSINQTLHLKYPQITRVEEDKGLVALWTSGRPTAYFDMDSFTEGSGDEAVTFLKERIGEKAETTGKPEAKNTRK